MASKVKSEEKLQRPPSFSYKEIGYLISERDWSEALEPVKGVTLSLGREDDQGYCHTWMHEKRKYELLYFFLSFLLSLPPSFPSMDAQLEEGELSEVIEENTTSDSEQSDEEWHLKGSLPVAPMDGSFDPNAEPTSGEEYLRLVRYGAWQLPFAVKATEEQLLASRMASSVDPIDTLSRQLDANAPSVPAHLLPSQEFIDSFMESFLEGCRPILDEEEVFPETGTNDDSRYPPLGHETEWRALLYPSEDRKEATEDSREDEEGGENEESLSPLEVIKERCSRKRPRMHSIEPDDIYRASPSQRQLLQLIKYHRQWMAASEPCTINTRQYQFIIRILQLLDTRMTPWQASILRDLAMLMIHVRGRTHHEAPAGETNEGLGEKSILFYVNGIIVAIARRFGQVDLLTK